MLRYCFTIAILFMLTTSLVAQEKETIFEDCFDGQLKEGWAWKRENPKGYRFVKNTLEVLMEPFADHEARNVLFRPSPNRKTGVYQIELMFDTQLPFENQYQQVGLFWMQDEKVVFKFVREMIDGNVYIFPGKIPVEGETTFLRLTVSGDNIVTEFKTKEDGEYKPAFEGKLPTYTEGECVGIQCWHGPAKREHWIKLKRFGIFKQK